MCDVRAVVADRPSRSRQHPGPILGENPQTHRKSRLRLPRPLDGDAPLRVVQQILHVRQFFPCTAMPRRVTYPITSSPGIGLQHLERYTIDRRARAPESRRRSCPSMRFTVSTIFGCFSSAGSVSRQPAGFRKHLPRQPFHSRGRHKDRQCARNRIPKASTTTTFPRESSSDDVRLPRFPSPTTCFPTSLACSRSCKLSTAGFAACAPNVCTNESPIARRLVALLVTIQSRRHSPPNGAAAATRHSLSRRT